MPDFKVPIARPIIGDEEKNAVLEVLSSGHLTQGRRVEAFEKEFAKYIGVKHAVAVNSGTAALHLATMAIGMEPGDEVITSTFSFAASANCALYCGAVPVFADIDPKTFNISPNSIEDKLTDRTKAIIPVHLYGQPADMGPIMDIAKSHGIVVIEDAAQAHGAEYRKRRAGSIGNIGCFSFYPTKNMTTAEGGMVTTNDDAIADRVAMLRNHGQKTQYFHTMLGYNFRMTDVTAAIGIEQLKKLEKFNETRTMNSRFITESLAGVPGIFTPFVSPEVRHVFHQYTLRVASGQGRLDRDGLQQMLTNMGIQTRVYYPMPIHKQELYARMGYVDSLPEAEKASREVLSIPVHPGLTKEQLDYTISSIKEIMK